MRGDKRITFFFQISTFVACWENWITRPLQCLNAALHDSACDLPGTALNIHRSANPADVGKQVCGDATMVWQRPGRYLWHITPRIRSADLQCLNAALCDSLSNLSGIALNIHRSANPADVGKQVCGDATMVWQRPGRYLWHITPRIRSADQPAFNA